MRYGSEMIGMPVTANETGRMVGRVKEVIISRKTKCVVGYLLQHANWFQKARLVPFSEVEWLAEDSVAISTEETVVALEQVSAGKRVCGRSEFIGVPLMSANGHEFGRIHDICINEHSGEIEGFAVLTGYLPDDMSGPEFLPLNDDIVIGRSSVLVGEEAADRLMFEATEIGRLAHAQQNGPTSEIPHAVREEQVVRNATDNLIRHAWKTTGIQLDAKMQPIVQRIGTFWHRSDRA